MGPTLEPDNMGLAMARSYTMVPDNLDKLGVGSPMIIQTVREGMSGSTMNPQWIHCGSTADPLWIHNGSTTDPQWIRCGSIVDPHCIHCGFTADPLWIQWIHRGSTVDPQWIHYGSPPRINCGSTVDPLWISTVDPEWISPCVRGIHSLPILIRIIRIIIHGLWPSKVPGTPQANISSGFIQGPENIYPHPCVFCLSQMLFSLFVFQFWHSSIAKLSK